MIMESEQQIKKQLNPIKSNGKMQKQLVMLWEWQMQMLALML